MYGVECKYWSCLNVPIITLRDPQSVILDDCHLPDIFVRKILRRLYGAGDTLQRLRLDNMYLKPFQGHLDELLNNQVAHHERINNSSQRKLNIRLAGKYLMRTNLSERFVRKCNSHCQELESIDLYIYEESYYYDYPLRGCRSFCVMDVCGCWLLCCC